MRRMCAMLVVFAVALVMASAVLARGAPKRNQPVVVEKAVAETAPVLVSIPPLSAGYDVICNLSESETLMKSVTTERREQSTTGAWRGYVNQTKHERGSPELVLLA